MDAILSWANAFRIIPELFLNSGVLGWLSIEKKIKLGRVIFSLNFYFIKTISCHTDHFKIQKKGIMKKGLLGFRRVIFHDC